MATETATAPPGQETPAAASPQQGATKPPKAKAEKKGSKNAAKGKDSKPAKGGEPGGEGPSVAAHPRAAHQVARAKSWGGLAGFALGGYLSLPTHTLAQAGLRALEAGVICYVFAWAAAVFLWRHLVVLEIKSREQQLYDAANSLPQRPAQNAPGRAGKSP